MVNGQCLTTMVTTSWWSSGQDMGFGGLGMANSKSGDYNLFSPGKVVELLRWPKCWYHKIRDLCHIQLHPTWFEPTYECRSWPVASYLYSGHLPVGLYLGLGSLMLVDPLFHFRYCHSGLVPSRNEHVCPCHSMTRAGSWYGKSKGSRCPHPQLPANRNIESE